MPSHKNPAPLENMQECASLFVRKEITGKARTPFWAYGSKQQILVETEKLAQIFDVDYFPFSSFSFFEGILRTTYSSVPFISLTESVSKSIWLLQILWVHISRTL